MTRIYTHLATVLLGLAMLTLVGCTTPSERQFITAKNVRGKTPELATITRSEGQLKNKEAKVINSYIRGMRTDISRVLLLDHNTRLVPYNLP